MGEGSTKTKLSRIRQRKQSTRFRRSCFEIPFPRYSLFFYFTFHLEKLKTKNTTLNAML